jgi:hypothetical protein
MLFDGDTCCTKIALSFGRGDPDMRGDVNFAVPSSKAVKFQTSDQHTTGYQAEIFGWCHPLSIVDLYHPENAVRFGRTRNC